MEFEFKLPDIGEGVAEGEILRWMVKEGDHVQEDQSLVEVITDKVNVQIPSPKNGVVSRILAKEGQVVKVGQVILAVQASDEQFAPVSQKPMPAIAAQSLPVPPQTQQLAAPMDRVVATPATRRLARELGVEITRVKGTGPSGRVTDDDVRGAQAGPSAIVQSATVQLGNEERVPLRGVRKAVAERMTKSSNIAAHVTVVDDVDVTELVLFREAFKGSAEKRGVRLTFLPLIIKAVVPALKQFPYVNASLDDAKGEIVLKKYYNMGVATDTEQGLVVPVVRDIDRKDIFQLSGEIEKLAEKARAGQLSLDDVRGSTFTITNIGSIGGLFTTPIINYPEVAIFGINRITKRPVVKDGKIQVRDMMYLSLSFDHRVLDGAYATRFLEVLIDTIQDPKKLLAEIL